MKTSPSLLFHANQYQEQATHRMKLRTLMAVTALALLSLGPVTPARAASTLNFGVHAVPLACLGNPDPVDMKVYCPTGKETFDDETTEEASSRGDRCEAA
jgi:hypothetical protein